MKVREERRKNSQRKVKSGGDEREKRERKEKGYEKEREKKNDETKIR